MNNRIKQIVKEKGLKNTWLAEQMGINACDISHWSSGHRKPNQDNLKTLAKLCGVPVKALYPNVKRRTYFEI